MNGLKLVMGLVVCAAPAVLGNSCCDFKLDALNKTLFRLKAGAQEVSDKLETYQTNCCEQLMGRDIGCSCATTPITSAGALPSSGSYCLANDITGDITAAGLQVNIDLKGHTVTGNVTVGDHGYVYDGAITNTLMLGSYSHAEFLRIGVSEGDPGSVVGSASSGVLLSNITFEDSTDQARVDGFSSITFDETVFKRGVNFTNTSNVVIRRSQSAAINHQDQTLNSMHLYDVSVHGEGAIVASFILNPAFFGVWNSTFDVLQVQFQTSFIGNFHGSTFAQLIFANQTPPGDPAIIAALVDECSLGNLTLLRMFNIRCQHCVVDTSVAPAIYATDCQQATFDHVQAYSGVNSAFSIMGGQNISLKQCSGIASSGMSVAFNIDDSDNPLSNVNLYECLAKDSFQGFSFGSSTLTGTVLHCIAENCTEGFTVVADSMSMAFAGNVSVSNSVDYSSTVAFNPSNDPITAVSWRNIESA